MKKRVAVRASGKWSCFACFFPSTEENETNFRTDQGSLGRLFSPAPLEIETVVATCNRSDIEKIGFVKLESGNLTLQFHSKSKSVAYTLSEELVESLQHIEQLVEQLDVSKDSQTNSSIELNKVSQDCYQTLELVLRKCPQGEVIGSDEFKEAIQGYVSEHLASTDYNEIRELFKGLDYLQYKEGLFEFLTGLQRLDLSGTQPGSAGAEELRMRLTHIRDLHI